MGQQYFPIHINYTDSHKKNQQNQALKTNLGNICIIDSSHWLNNSKHMLQGMGPSQTVEPRLGAAPLAGAGSRQRSLGCLRPRAKNNSCPTKFNGSCVLTN